MATDNHKSKRAGWVGFDLDKTIAVDDGDWKGPHHIGEPIWPMIVLMKRLIAEGTEVRIFTARVSGKYSMTPAVRRQAESIERSIKVWALDVVGCDIVVTCVKDWDMLYFYDDKARQVVENKGVTVQQAIGVMILEKMSESGQELPKELHG
jgi:hypothetical protein